MKKNIFIFLGIFSLMFNSCSFLEESSQDQIKPSTVNDLVSLMLYEGYIRQDRFFEFSELLTDNVMNRYPNNGDQQTNDQHIKAFEKYGPFFTWDKEMFEKAKLNDVDKYNMWEYLYKKIMGCNVIMSMIDEVTGPTNAKENLKGQALTMRAFYYFMLVNIYSEPYNSGDPNQLLGVPLILEPQVKDSYPPRNKLSTVYEQIIEDLNTALPLLKEYGKENLYFRASDKLVYVLLSRVYLYMNDWARSIEYASLLIEEYPSLTNLSNCYEVIEDWFGPEYKFNPEKNICTPSSAELIYGYGTSQTSSSIYLSPFPYELSDLAVPVFSVSNDLLRLYENDKSGSVDLRIAIYYTYYLAGMVNWAPVIFPLFGTKGDGVGSVEQGIRTSEAYLNRAEANIRLVIEGKGGNINNAISDLNTLRSHRFDMREGQQYTNLTAADFASDADLLKFCLDERRREFAFEHHRWFDLRRCGMPELKHNVETVKGQVQTITLAEKSTLYTLPIPQVVIDRNPSIVQNKL